MGLKPELVEALKRVGFVNATEVQEHAIPVALEGKDMIVRAKTGTGKTGAFLVPILQNATHEHGVQALIIVPTRELALQVSQVAASLGTHVHQKVATVYGGASMNVQIDAIRRGASIIVGTPGRLLDLMGQGALRVDKIRFLVLDEADIMLDMGFVDDIDEILSMTPRERQTMLFSATLPQQIQGIARNHMKQEHQKITVGKEEEPTVATISHAYARAHGKAKFGTLLAYIDQFKPQKAIIFTATQREADLIHSVMVQQGHNTIVIHGGLTQAKREHSLQAFRQGARFMVATNVASRGLDIPDVTDVINFDAPDDAYQYIHRVGRSARMGKNGRAFTLIGVGQEKLVTDIQFDANVRLKELHLNTDQYRNLQLPMRGHGRFGDRRGGGGRFNDRRGGGGGGGFRGGYGERRGGRGGGEHRGGDRHGGGVGGGKFIRPGQRRD